MKEAVGYIIKKLTGAGFALTLGFAFFLFLVRFDLFEYSEGLSNPFYWGILYGYGIFASIIIDFITNKVTFFNKKRTIILYAVAGFTFFILNGINPFTLIAGLIGAVCAAIFYLGTYLSDKNTYFKYSFAFVLPLSLLLLSSFDFSEKEGWQATTEAESFHASFDYFNGKHEIPLQVKEGDQITFKLDVSPTNGGGHGFHVKNDKGDLVGLEDSGNKMTFVAEYSGIYHIVIKGDDLKGEVAVFWEYN
ncbi:hypothetical protein ACFYKX_02800 [Cytobacillus sp. FJAT-54145]|uniref:Uncharacterized protein n=1 Tax=Cytobacillus spartinae TaxID=3299023 RepID=A0ABW6K7I9_9BACI